MGSDKRNDSQKTMRDGQVDRNQPGGSQQLRDQQGNQQQMRDRDGDTQRFDDRKQSVDQQQMRDRDGNLDGRQGKLDDTRRSFDSKDGKTHTHSEQGQTFTHQHADGHAPHNHRHDDPSVKGYDRQDLRGQQDSFDKGSRDVHGKVDMKDRKPDVELQYGRDDDKRNPQGGHENIDKHRTQGQNVDMRGSDTLGGNDQRNNRDVSRDDHRRQDDISAKGGYGGVDRDFQGNRDNPHGGFGSGEQRDVHGKDLQARGDSYGRDDQRQDWKDGQQQDLKGRAGDKISQQIDQKEQQLSQKGRSVTIENMEKDADDGRMGAIGGHSLRDGGKGGKQKKDARSPEQTVNPQVMKDGTKSRTDRPRT